MQNMNQIHQSYAKIDIVKNLNAKVYHKNFKSKTLTLRSCRGVGVLRRKILDQSIIVPNMNQIHHGVWK